MVNFQNLSQLFPEMTIKYNEALANYSYTKTGGPADVIVFPKSKTEVQQIIDWVNQHQVPLTVFGNLSNLIVRDGGMAGIVMILTQMNHIEVSADGIYAESGAAMIETSQQALAAKFTGLEFACGIPGSVGGAVFMNAGAYEGEVKDCIQYVDVLTAEGELKRFSNEESQFTYRNSIFQDNQAVILGAFFALGKGDSQAIKERMDHLTYLRQSKQPLEYPSCGSVFKRPEGYFTGKLIQDAGLQGYRIGGAEISRKHAGFIVNVAEATATDYTEMIAFIQETIFNKYGVHLETEVRILGREKE
ncbi:UDP-N-acetylmuramate dehydrogenase [Ignavigranum ruoffiae]|nr:UDP-N-acetylmuramate dehydrogenase [Ignavigranum ruoffiae]UPQ86114.1 UDP-N-acetylmuramate dehydrogenase [Ignavigranum ruoffiae]